MPVTGEFVSAIKKVEAPDGTTFDILRHAPEGAAQLRGGALVRMRDIVREGEPENINLLETHSGLSAEYAMSSAIMHSKKPEVKADLTRVSVDEHLAEGSRWGAVRMLAYAGAAELPLSQYGDEWVAGQYDAALSEGDANEAWMIARTMLLEGDKIVKRESTPEDTEGRPPKAWIDREKRAFEQHAEEVLAREEQPADVRDDWELRNLFDEMRFRQDGGFTSDNPNELSRRIAEKTIQKDLSTKGREWTALIDATEARMSDDYIANLRSQVSPTAMDRAKKWFTGVRVKVDNLVHRG